MQDKTLLTIALTTGFIGLAALFIILETSNLEETPLNEIETDNGMVKIIGTVSNTRQTEKTTFLSIEQTSTINAVIFEPVSIQKNQKVEIIGTTDEYQGETEILVEKIRVLG